MPETTDPLTIGRRYAGAYAAFDTSELLDVLAPNLRFRQVNPGGYLELDNAHAYVDATSQFLDSYDTHSSAGASAEPIGDRRSHPHHLPDPDAQRPASVTDAALGDRHGGRRQGRRDRQRLHGRHSGVSGPEPWLPYRSRTA